ncbi:type II secretion system F family protein [Streptomyces sp. NPDC002067]
MSVEVFHRVWMVAGVTLAVVVGEGVWAWARRERRRRIVRRRAGHLVHRLPGRASAGRGRRWTPGSGQLTEWLGPLGVACFVLLLVGGASGAVTGVVAGYVAHRWRLRQRAADADRSARDAVRDALAPAGDLLAACLAAGAGPREAAEAVGRSLEGAVGERLRTVAAELRLGGEPAVAWRRLAELPGAGGLARCMARAGISGAPAVDAVSRIAAELRAEAARTTAARARRAGVLVTLPLAACFLPAFLTLGVAPVLIGLAGGMLGHR